MTHQPGPPEASAAQREAARAAALRALHTWQLVRQARLPARALTRHMEPEVIDALDQAAEPAPSGQTEELAGLRLEMVTDRLAHGGAVLRDHHGTTQAVVLELRRDGEALPWTVTQLSPAAQRTLVSYTPDDVSDRRTASHRLPDDLTEALQQARQARDEAAAWVAHHRGNTSPREAPQRQRWRERLRELEQEVQDLEDAQQARDVRQAVLDGDPTVASRIHQLEDLLGEVPDDAQRRDQWRAAARLLVGYRQRWGVTYLHADLATEHAEPVRNEERDAAVTAVEDYTGQPFTRNERTRKHEPLHRDASADSDLSLDL